MCGRRCVRFSICTTASKRPSATFYVKLWKPEEHTVALNYFLLCVSSSSVYECECFCGESIRAKVSVYVFICSLYTKCEIKRVSLHACQRVCVPECVFTSMLIAVADMASCLVRLITPLSAALGSMCWWIPQQRSSWPRTQHSQWLITDAAGFWLCHTEGGRKRHRLTVYVSELDPRLGEEKKNLTLILYRACEQSLDLMEAATNRPDFQRWKSYLYSFGMFSQLM